METDRPVWRARRVASATWFRVRACAVRVRDSVSGSQCLRETVVRVCAQARSLSGALFLRLSRSLARAFSVSVSALFKPVAVAEHVWWRTAMVVCSPRTTDRHRDGAQQDFTEGSAPAWLASAFQAALVLQDTC